MRVLLRPESSQRLFSVFDLFSVLTALGIDLTEREAKQPEGAIISFACWIAVIARWLAVVVFALNAQGSSPYKLVSSKDPMTDYARVITSSFSLRSKTRVKRPRAAALFQLLQLTCPLLTVAMAIATLLLPGEEGSNVSKKTADATRALKQASDVVAVASGVTGTGTPDFTEPDPEPVLDTAQKYAAYSLKYASSVLTSLSLLLALWRNGKLEFKRPCVFCRKTGQADAPELGISFPVDGIGCFLASGLYNGLRESIRSFTPS